jgi:hypothetical protein
LNLALKLENTGYSQYGKESLNYKIYVVVNGCISPSVAEELLQPLLFLVFYLLPVDALALVADLASATRLVVAVKVEFESKI